MASLSSILFAMTLSAKTDVPDMKIPIPDFAPAEIITEVIEVQDTLALPPQPEKLKSKVKPVISIYALPYSWTANSYDWKRMWVNAGVLTTAFVGSLIVLECLPEDATSWNRAAIQKDPPGKRWVRNVFKLGPCFDKDKLIFNFVLHPYAGAAYFMGARSAGFNYWRSLLFSSLISTVGWEFGIEACMERPSIQDIFITPIVGSLIGEGFYKLKRHIVDNGYCVLGSPFLGGLCAWLIDPLNEFTGLFLGNPARRVAHEKAMQKRGQYITLTPTFGPSHYGFSLQAVF